MNINGYEIKSFADLHGADLREADLYGADLYGADLHGADLREANLRAADLREADLRGANLYGANLRAADLREADLYGAKNIPPLIAAQTSICAEGDLRVYKKTRQGVVVLRIPAAAKRSNATGRKCRAAFAEVLETPNGEPAQSLHDAAFIYRVGETVRPNGWCEDRWRECASGIQFYLTREEAEAHV